MNFQIVSDFRPAGSQPQAIRQLAKEIAAGKTFQTLLGVTGSGKTFTMANVIEQAKRPTLVIVHNKTLAAQLYEELKDFFPNNAVEYFVSYYDYYQPESYIPAKDQYIEKDASVNPKIEQMRLAATASLLSRKDVIVVASVSCIYGVGNPENFAGLGFSLETKQAVTRKEIVEWLVDIQFERNDMELGPGRFRVKGDTLEIIPGYGENRIRIEMFGDEIERITEVDKVTGTILKELPSFFFFPARHFVIPESKIEAAIELIGQEMKAALPGMGMIEAHRLKQRTLHDIDTIREMGYCKGIENYSRHFEGRKKGERPYCLLDYFPKDFLIIIDESHQTIPQIHGMYKGDRSRKQMLIDYGFRLESALDNRPLKFAEFEVLMKKNKVIFVSATPADYELEQSGKPVEQIIRPTGLIDPDVQLHPITGQVEHLLEQIEKTIKANNRVLVTTLTKKLAEELSEFLSEKGVKARYLHADIPTLERTELIRQLRLGAFDVLIGINLLREGLDIPEVGFIGIFDADKEGFLRNSRSLIQTIGRAARNIDARVILYADTITDSIRQAMTETKRRRELQLAHNEKHGITPKQIVKPVRGQAVAVTEHMPKKEIPNALIQLTAEMHQAAEEMNFERAIELRDFVRKLEKRVKPA